MRLHRFIGNFNLSQKQIEITDPENIKQIKGVLRLEVGDQLILSDGQGKQAEVQITSIAKNAISCDFVKEMVGGDPIKKVNLYLAILKKENFELAVQKAVEVGVSNIIPIITERTIKTGLNTERLNKIIKEASEQSGRSIVPTLSPIVEFEKALSNNPQVEEKIIFHFVNETYKPNNTAKSANIFIGPEGGFTEKEIALAQNAGYVGASLGPLTLRGETAAIVATYRVISGI